MSSVFKASNVKGMLKTASLVSFSALMTACGGGGGGGGTPVVSCLDTITTNCVTSIDSDYSGKWGWRGTGEDGPRGVAVDPWGAGGTVADFNTTESRDMGGYYYQPVGSTGYWINGGDPLGAIGARDAYARGLDGSGVIVAVVDTAVDFSHSELAGKNAGQYNASSGTMPSAGDHGTHVAGIIAASANGQGMHGVASGASIYGISFGETSGGYLDINTTRLANGVRAATDKGARIFNNSWGSGTVTNGSSSLLDNSYYRSAVADAIDSGAVFVWAAGNDFYYNQSYGNQNTSEEAKAALKYSELAGGFVNVVNLRYDAGNWEIANASTGDSVPGYTWPDSQICGVTKDFCLGAPGTAIESTVVGGGYEEFSGTSMAAPSVAGGIAILFQAFPYVETADILQLLFTTADDLGAAGVDEVYGHGMMNLAAALNPVGSLAIPTSASTDTNVGIDARDSRLLAEGSLSSALNTAAANMVALDDFDRAYVIGNISSTITNSAALDAASVATALQGELASIAAYGTPISDIALTAAAQETMAETFDLDGIDSQLFVSAVDKGLAGSAEARLISTQQDGALQVSRSIGLIEEFGQLFGNQGSGALALADGATTVSLGTSATFALAPQVVVFGGASLNQTMVDGAEGSLFTVGNIASAAAMIGLRVEGLGIDEGGAFAVQIGQDRFVLDSDASMAVPVGRESGGIILFDRAVISDEALSALPELKISYSETLNGGYAYALSATASEQETVIAGKIGIQF